jgi:hypothetical protein
VLLAGGLLEAAPINLLTNGSFEQNSSGDGPGDLIGWTLTESNANGGDHIAHESDNYSGVTDGVIVLKFNGGNNTPDAVLEQTFGTGTGKTYELSFDIGKVATGGGTAQVSVDVLGETGDNLFSGTASDSDGSGHRDTNVQPEEFVHFSDVFLADGASATLRVTDTSTNNGSNYDLLLDNFVVTPEPGSGVLLAVGMLVLAVGCSRRGEQGA